MDKREIARYNYLYDPEDTSAAQEYLDYLEPTLNQRRKGVVTENIQKLAEEAPVLSSVLSVPLNLMSGAGTVDILCIVCADSVEEIRQIAELGPNLIVAEPTELIGTGVASDMGYVVDTIEAVRKINPDIMVLQGAGISGPDDVANVIRAGAQATGCTSGILKAADPEAAAEEMLYALRKTWNEVHGI